MREPSRCIVSKKPPTSSCASHGSIASQLLVNVRWVDIKMSWVQRVCKSSQEPQTFTKINLCR